MLIRGQFLDCAVAADVTDFIEDEPMGVCPMCDAVNAPIGKLGDVAHFTCRCCGAWFNEQEAK